MWWTVLLLSYFRCIYECLLKTVLCKVGAQKLRSYQLKCIVFIVIGTRCRNFICLFTFTVLCKALLLAVYKEQYLINTLLERH